MLTLYIGDPHGKPKTIPELELLMCFARDSIIKHQIDRLIILGDLMHTHAVLRLEVVDFWDKWLEIFSLICETIVIPGNHDQTGDYNSASHSLAVFKRMKHLKIFDTPTRAGAFGFIPYIHKEEEFVKLANNLCDEGAKTLIVHQTFDGGVFESGMYVPDGIKVDLIKADLIISGHLHTRHRFNKVIYPGTSYWQTDADVNQPKGLWLVNHDISTGSIVSEEFLDTSHIVKPILGFQWKEGEPKPEMPSGARVTLELIGSSDWVSFEKNKLKGSISVKSRFTDTKKTINRETGGNLTNFLSEHFTFTPGVNKDLVLNYLKEI